MTDVKIIHPGLGPDHIATVPADSLAHHFAAGWRPLADDELPPAEEAAASPEPMTKAQAAKAAKQAQAPSESEK